MKGKTKGKGTVITEVNGDIKWQGDDTVKTNK